jgi:thymidine kinase
MFVEHTGGHSGRKGCIEVVCGSMFSGKTEELIRRMRRAEFAKLRTGIFKPGTDVRYHHSDVVSHDRRTITAVPVRDSAALLPLAAELDVAGIDEAQFFDAGLPRACELLAAAGVRVIVAGLDMDFQGRPFGPMPHLLAIAEFVTKVHAICLRCGELASFSHRTHASERLILLGETDSYEPLCRNCYLAARGGQEGGRNTLFPE